MNEDLTPEAEEPLLPPVADKGVDEATIGLAHLPPTLRNWQVLEQGIKPDGVTIDGKATLVAQSVAGVPLPRSAELAEVTSKLAAVLGQPPARADEVIGATLAVAQQRVEAGVSATFALTMRNQGEVTALFSVVVEGWLDEGWVAPLPPYTKLDPGEETTLTIAITPPRSPTSAAGDHALAIIVRATEYPQRLARVLATLTIAPFDDLRLGECRPSHIISSWFQRTGQFSLPVSNQSNRPVAVRMQGSAAGEACHFAFAVLERPRGQAGVAQAGQGTLTLQPGQRTMLSGQVTPLQRTVLSLNKERIPLRISATVGASSQTAVAQAELLKKPLIGPWHLAGVSALAVVGMIGAGLVAMLATVLALRPAPTPQPAAAPLAVIVQLPNSATTSDRPVATTGDTAIATAPVAQQPEATPIAFVPAGDRLDPTLPLVLPDQVTSPGEPTRTGSAFVAEQPVQSASAPITAETSSNPTASMTYQQMFQEVATRYDLDWRLLAAQAYIESGFDSLALGNNGDMGLMQILPGTWKEWAPVVNVNDPFDAHSNALVAATYLNHLRDVLGKQGHSQPEWMLVAYNWGPDKVNDHLAAGGSFETLPEVRKNYALDILRVAQTIPTQ